MVFPERASGILLHPTSLPGPYGIGTLGKAAFDFIDFLARARQRYWKILPLGPTGYADSPYQCFSAHAGNPNLIDFNLLVREGYLEKKDLWGFPDLGDGPIQFDLLQKARLPLLKKAFDRFSSSSDAMAKTRCRNFIKEEYRWLNDYALFRAIKSYFAELPWYDWDEKARNRDPKTLNQLQSKLHESIEFHKFLQHLFFRQWRAVREYAHKRKIKIIGDIPLYIARDSADSWANTSIFEFDEQGKPLRVGGVPPDYFSETGQLWGNPLFRWKDCKEVVYAWWVDRIRTNLNLYDIIRIDHFRGFAAYWAVPFGEKTAVNGKWIPGPGIDFFTAMENALGDLPIIAEDLGVITPDVEKLRDSFGFPGMKILEFAFDSSEANDYLPHNYPKNCIVYTGTHDNDSVAAWFHSVSEEDQALVLEYLNSSGKEITWDFVRLAWASVALTAIAPMQDLLGLNESARMNLPGTITGNWLWRAKSTDFTPDLATRLARLTELYGRARKLKILNSL